MDFRPVNTLERQKLIAALRGNAELNKGLLLDPRDTSFIGSEDDEVADLEVINAIRSTPCHY